MKAISSSIRARHPDSQRRLIYEMMEASMLLSLKKGPHALEKSCSCVVCVNKRKQILNGPARKWKFTL